MTDAPQEPGYLPLQRSEALTDGIYAVAMTLLVIELKLPEHTAVHSSADLNAALIELVPKAIAWALSFFVLALFWVGHHRVFARLRRADSTLLRFNLLQLAFVSLMPFASALTGEFGGLLVSQGIYSLNMAALGVTAWLVLRHAYTHPELCHAPLARAHYLGAQFRIGGVIVISVVAFAISTLVPFLQGGNLAFLLMGVIAPWSHRIERRADHAPSSP